jgi:hypothetical protein
MEKHIARFANLTPTVKRHEASSGIPPELYEMFSARRTYVFMAPEGLKGPISGGAGIVGGDGGGAFRVGLAICPPGNGPVLHVHMSTHETFVNVKGKWEVRGGTRPNTRHTSTSMTLSRSAVGVVAPMSPSRRQGHRWLTAAAAWHSRSTWNRSPSSTLARLSPDRRRHDTPLTGSAYGDRIAAYIRVVALLDRRVEGIG